MCNQLRGAIVIAALLLLAGCGKPYSSGFPGGSSSAKSGATTPTPFNPNGPEKQYACDLDGLSVVLVNNYSLSWDVKFSPDWHHVIVDKSERGKSTRSMDGVALPQSDGSIPSIAWSGDNTTWMLATDHSIRYKGTAFGPYKHLTGMALSTDGLHWAAIDSPQPFNTANINNRLIVDGVYCRFPASMPAPVNDIDFGRAIQYDSSLGKFIFPVVGPHGKQWLATDGTAAQAPPPMAEMPFAPAPLPGINVEIKMTPRVTKYGIPNVARQELIVNKQSIGTFDCVWAKFFRDKTVQPLSVEPNGKILFYAADDLKLYRLLVKP